ncbi:MAG: DEAD/DEAH box helicase family protein [Candidatus Peregrinibacteria bacterium]|nr:DEAD/DEAH box helicase family protein [Candidatus Peregrinibacteria bacterium]
MTHQSESKTRQEIIDDRLKKAGWNVKDPSQVTEELDIWVGLPEDAEEPMNEFQGHRFADYVLLGEDGYPLAVVEAKKTARDARVGQEQAKQYADNIAEKAGREMPFVFFTNGHDIYFWDTERYPPRKVYGFPTRKDLERLKYLRTAAKPLSQELINRDIAERPYQIEAIRRVLEGVEKAQRKFLLVMATGTGKTRTCVSLLDVLMRGNRAQRVLFLVDRVALLEQARDAFREFLPNAPIWPKQGEKEIATDRRIYIGTYPTLLNIIEKVDCPLSPHFFDLIVADESHRSIYNVYRNIFDYFDCIQLGLTATPTDAIEHNTFDLFQCEDGDPTFAYTYEEAVNNKPPYLSTFEAFSIQTKFQNEGIHHDKLSIEDQKKLLSEGKEPEDINFEGTDLEKKVSNKGTNALIVQEFMEECIKDDSGTLPGKTIFFAMTKKHAYRLQEIFDSLYPELKGKIAKVLVSEDNRVHGRGGLLDQFKNNDMPRIAISVDMLDTGIDVREIVNLVFAKPVFSYTKFWQMIGRGTRLLEPKAMKPWCSKKDKFLIMDCWNNFAYFEMNPKGKEDRPTKPLPVRVFETRLQKYIAAEKAGEKLIAANTIKALRADIAKLPENNVVVLDAKSKIDRLDDAFWKALNSDKQLYLQKEIAPLMRSRSNEDFKGMGLELNMLQLSVARLEANAEKIETLEQVIIEKVSDLPMTVNTVAKEQELVESILNNGRIHKADDDELQEIQVKLAPLMKFRDEGFKIDQEKINLRDITADKQFIEFGPANERVTVQKYREKVEALIKKLEAENPILQKVKAGENLSNKEVEQLADTLEQYDPYPTEKNLQKAYDARRVQFLDLIRYIMGIGELKTFPDKVSEAFAEFITQHNTMTAKQIQFLQTLQTFIVENGKLDKKDLTREPFTRFHAKGFLGLFKPKEREEILTLATSLLTHA